MVQTTHGKLEGIKAEHYTKYLGVPYAKAPIGALRWKAPQSLEPWEGILKADSFPNMTVQELPKDDNPFTAVYKKEFYENPDYIPPMSEDCLYMNLYVPDHDENAKMPIAFWIHGGGFSGGYASELEFDGEAYCKRGIIFIAVEYRCGALGFLAHPWLSAENEQGISGNYGILDQITALKWVQDNAAAFGGDPDNITIMGQSAGAMSIQVLISSPLANSIAAKAILQSGLASERTFDTYVTTKEAEKYGEKFVEFAGVTSKEELYAMTPEEILNAQDKLSGWAFQNRLGLVLLPNIDGYVLPKNITDVYQAKEMQQIPYLTGVCTKDLGSDPAEEAAGLPCGLLMNNAQKWALATESIGQPTYIYHFKHPLPNDTGYEPTFHSSEIWYMQATLGRCWRPLKEDDFAVSEAMVDAWAEFIKTGKPGEDWPSYTANQPYVKVF